MSKIQASLISIIMSVKIESEDRLRNLKINLDFYKSYFEDYEIIIVEQGEVSSLGEINFDRKIRHFFIPTLSCHYKAHNLNLATSLATRQIVIMTDVDVICNPSSIKKAIQSIQNGSSFIAPYNGIVAEISKGMSVMRIEEIVSNLAYFPKNFQNDLKSYDYSMIKPMFGNMNYNNTGGYIIYTKEAFYSIGGWNTNFISYGYEDMEFVYRIHKLGYELVRYEEYNIYHLEHSRSYESYYNNFYRMNEAEWLNVKSMNTTNLLKYALNGFRKIIFDNNLETNLINTERAFLIESKTSTKIDLLDLLIIIPVYMPEIKNLGYLTLLIYYFEQYFRNYEVIIVEGETRNCKYLSTKKNTRYIWLGTESYCEKTAIDRALKESSKNIIAIWDYRTMINPSLLVKKLRYTITHKVNTKIKDYNWYLKKCDKIPGHGVLLLNQTDITRNHNSP
ncbi:MAG: glycosyltransferase family 2 protein [Mucilaginibacter sp.]|uniref:glycosyltransferase n=1 Tax=Mucilaginibacter sp. TaxID=1882438 RepID=UPI00326583DC